MDLFDTSLKVEILKTKLVTFTKIKKHDEMFTLEG